MKQQILLALFLCAFKFGTAQNSVHKIPDSLKNKSYTYLDDKIYSFKNDSTKAAAYLFAYLNKSKNEKNWKELVYAYQNILHQSPENLRLIYADSMVYAAKKTTDNALVGSAYLSKGIAFYGKKQYDRAFDNYIIANNFIAKSGDKYLTYKVKHQIAQIKYYLGFYNEAISLFRECLDYFKEENSRAYLNTLHSLGVCYNRIGNYELCSQTNKIGLSESKSLGNTDMDAYFIHSEGINDYFQQNYGYAITKIESSLEAIRENKDFANESVANFYIGKSYWAMDKKDKALPYFLKVNKTFDEKNYLRPDLREVYELLINYYKDKKDLKTQLYYIDQLLKADDVLNETYMYLIAKIHKEYDTKELLLEKEAIEEKLSRAKFLDIIFVSIIFLLFILSLFLTYRHYNNRKLYKKKFDELMERSYDLNQNKPKLKNEKAQILDIPQDTVTQVLKHLEKFELDKKFLGKDLRLATVAISLNTNSKYLYRILSHYKGKRFVEFINDLKIDFIVTLLKQDKMTRNYTNAALADEAGFSSTQQFVNAFKTRTGMPVNFFIQEISK